MSEMLLQIERLTLQQQFKLIEIAHTASNLEVKEAALQLLRNINIRPLAAVQQRNAAYRRATEV